MTRGWLLLLVLCSGIAAAQPARAELGCDQLVAGAQAAIALRDQGASLRAVLAELDKGAAGRFSPEDLAMLRRAAQLAYTGEISVYELSETCQASRGGNPRR